MIEKTRCAVYTRKSTEEGLEQDFNSLDAQREACEAYIKSQKGLGWTTLPKRYDDGGISGGTMERPALQELLADIDRGKVDLVVVYKVDRLTRSLVDFARIIETFDCKNVSFVSVTQQFNTANSMGRLTLNVLLSFAQFEREVTAERIRDKIAASKKKGMWMGGLPPLGYYVQDKKLVINQPEAETVRELFRLYLNLGSIPKLMREADQRGIRTKVRVIDGEEKGGRPFTRGHLQQLLRNPVYVGKIRHKREVFDGEHEAIVDEDVWDQVQGLLTTKAPKRTTAKNWTSGSLLTGLLFDETGDRLTPSHARKKGQAYRYYVSSRLTSGNKDDSTGWRLPQVELDEAVIDVLVEFLGGEDARSMSVDADGLDPAGVQGCWQHLDYQIGRLTEPGSQQREVVKEMVDRVAVEPDQLRVLIKIGTLSVDPDPDASLHEIVKPFRIRRRGVESKVILGSSDNQPGELDPKLIKLVADVRAWFDRIKAGEITEIRQLADEKGLDLGDVSRFLPLGFLAPDIVEEVVHGRQPLGLTSEKVKRIDALPMDWQAQRRALKFG